MAEWFTWKDGEVVRSVRLTDISAIEHHPGSGGSHIFIRGGVKLVISAADVGKLKAALGIKA